MLSPRPPLSPAQVAAYVSRCVGALASAHRRDVLSEGGTCVRHTSARKVVMKTLEQPSPQPSSSQSPDADATPTPTPTPAPERLLTASEVAELFRVSVKTVGRWGRAGAIPLYRTVG